MRRPDARSLLLLACLKLAAARVTVRYLAGCPDSTADNYYAPNPTGDQTDSGRPTIGPVKGNSNKGNI